MRQIIEADRALVERLVKVTVEYLDLADYVAIAAAVTGLDLQTVMKVATNLDLADSAPDARPCGFRRGRLLP